MSEFDVIRLLIAMGVLLLMAASAGFALLWQRQQQLTLALQTTLGLQTTQGLQKKSALQPETVPVDEPATASPKTAIKFSSTLQQTSAERGITSVTAPLGAAKGGYSQGREEDRLRAMLAGRTAVSSNGVSPQQRPGSP